MHTTRHDDIAAPGQVRDQFKNANHDQMLDAFVACHELLREEIVKLGGDPSGLTYAGLVTELVQLARFSIPSPAVNQRPQAMSRDAGFSYPR